MQGHVRKRGARWYFWVELERGPDGKRRQKSVGGFPTRRAAEDALEELRGEVRRGEYVERSPVTLTAFLTDEWLPARRAVIRATTWDHYRRIVEAYVAPTIGARPLSDLSPGHLNALYADLLQGGRRQLKRGSPAKPLSARSVRHVHTMLHKALNDAVRWGHLARNPADRADPPKPATPEMKAWSPEQLRVFLAHVEGDRLDAAWLLMATTGMRRGEVLGLRWSEVDLAHKRLAVLRAHVLANRQLVVSEPKTAKGRRTVALDEVTVAALQRHRRHQLEERLAAGEGWVDTGLLVTHLDGTAVDPRLFSSWFRQHARDAGLPHIRLHDVRHSYATAALAAGVPTKVVSERLGHASIAITLDTYSHVLPNMQAEAAEQVARLILGR